MKKFLMGRYFTAAMVTIVADFVTFHAMWALTTKDALEILIVSVIVGGFAGLGYLALTEGPDSRPNRHYAHVQR